MSLEVYQIKELLIFLLLPQTSDFIMEDDTITVELYETYSQNRIYCLMSRDPVSPINIFAGYLLNHRKASKAPTNA